MENRGQKNNIPNLEENYELVEKLQIETTPFILTGNKEMGYWAAMGMFRITETHKTKEEVITDLQDATWEKIYRMVYATVAGIQAVEQKVKEQMTKDEK